MGIEQIRELVPHAGGMCLLERVIEYSASTIRCKTRSHLDPGNPLVRDGHLSSICAIEYAAQAMALHGALSGTAHDNSGQPTAGKISPPAPARHGFLASVRDTRCRIPYLERLESDLIVSATILLRDSAHAMYSFVVAADGRELVSGRATVVLA